MREWLSELKYRLRLCFKRRQLEKDLHDELAFHISMKEQALKEASGMAPYTAARVRFGSRTTLHEECREVWVFGTLERLLRDIRYAIRSLLRTPSFTVIAIISLALGIGSTTGIFSMYNQLLLKTLPVESPSRLVNLGSPGPEPGNHSCGIAGDCDVVFSYPMFRDLERAQTVFTGIAGHVPFGANLAYHGQTIPGNGSFVSGSYFSVLGAKAVLGRLLGPEDDAAEGQSPVAVLSYAYWKAHLGENPSVLNDTIIVNGRALTIVGVTAAGFEGTTLGLRPAVYVPITLSRLLNSQSYNFNDRGSYWIYLFARMKPGVSIQKAHEGINLPYHAILNDVEATIQTGLTPSTLPLFKARQLTLDDGARGQSKVRSRVQTPLTLLLGVTGLVLLVACANIANLLLGRSAARSGELAIRVSIGAGRRHLIAQLLTEASLLALLGGAGGLLVGRWTVDLLGYIVTTSPSDEANLFGVFDPTVLIFAVLVTGGTVLLFGLFPALYYTRPDVLSSIKGLAGQSAGKRSSSRYRTALATFQMALSLVLLFAAGLFTRSLLNVSRVDLGVKLERLVTFSVSPAQNGYTPVQSKEFFLRLEEDLRKQPGISAVTASRLPLLGGGGIGWDVSVEGFVAAPDGDIESKYNEIGPGYFSTLGVPLIAGREFTESDNAGARKVVVVNEQFVKKFNLGPNPIGKRMGLEPNLDLEIVGVVKDSRYSKVRENVPPVFFRPYRQDYSGPTMPVGSMTLYVRATSDPDKALDIVQPTVARIDPNLPVENLRTMHQQIAGNTADDRMLGALSAAFASLSTLLAAVGLYGVMAYTVIQRSREFGVRLALGANPVQVQGLVLRQVVWVAAIGGAMGLVGAVGIGRVAQSLLFDLKGNDPLVLLGSAAVLSVVALVAGFIPAYRASKLDPLQALRHE